MFLALALVSTTTGITAVAASPRPASIIQPGTQTTGLAGDRRLIFVPAVEVGIATPVRAAAAIFSTAPHLGLSAALGRTGSRWRLPVSLWYRPTIDSSPAKTISFFGGWVHPEVAIMSRFVASIGAGWCWRHIEIGAVSSRQSALAVMASGGVRVRLAARTEGTLFVRYEFMQPVRDESFITEHLTLGLSLALLPR